MDEFGGGGGFLIIKRVKGAQSRSLEKGTPPIARGKAGFKSIERRLKIRRGGKGQNATRELGRDKLHGEKFEIHRGGNQPI